MAASYRMIQADFSSGEIDPMVEANVNLPYRANGLKESYNTLHLPNATVSKRPGLIREIEASFGAIGEHDAWTPVEIQMESGETCILFLGESARVILDGVFYDVPIYASEEEGETETIELAPSLRHTAVYQQYIFISYPEDTETGILMLHVVKDETEGIRVYKPSSEIAENIVFPSDIGACTRPLYVSNGRLIIGSKNVFNASRQRTERMKESETGFPTWILDFTLSDYQYDWVYSYSGTTSDGYTVSEKIVYRSFDEEPPEDPMTKKDGIQQRIRVISKDSQEWTVTETYAYREVSITDIRLKTTNSTGEAEIHTSETYPDKSVYETAEPEISKTDTPDPQSTHAIQVRENDMYGSSIKWITSAGRIIVGTETAIFIAVDQYLDPKTFDLVPTSQTGTSAQQPKILNQLAVFTSADRKRLYIGIYNDEIKGLQILEATANVKHMFLSGIKDYFIADNPYRVIYVITDDGECRVCIPVFTSEGGINFAWSTWDFGIGKVEYIAFDRRAEKEQKTYFIMRDADGKGWIYTLDYREPYLYGVKDTDLLLDYADIQTIKNTRGSVSISSPFLKHYSTLEAMLTYADGRQVVLRDCPVTVDDEGNATVLIDFRRTDIPETDDVTMKIGAVYVTRIALFQQILPNNSGVALVSRHSIEKLFLQIYRSQGGTVYAGDAKIADILQLQYGKDLYNNNSTNPLTGAPYTFSGVYSIDNPVQNVEEDNLSIVSDDPYPFNLMAVSMKYNLTEVY